VTVTTVDPDEWAAWVEANDALVLDIREPREWAGGTLPGSTLISMGELIERIDELPKNRPILCVCRIGSRSHQVAAYLDAIGFEGAANLRGGLKALGLQD
jgi:rhodanese-related sulfurtransferase